MVEHIVPYISSNRIPLLRWFLSSATLNVPLAAAPVAFSLVALSLTEETSGGAAIILVMTIAQVVGAIPVTRLGKNLHSASFLRLMVVFRTVALALIMLCTYYRAPFALLLPLAALAGSVNAAAYGYMRTILNQLTPASKLPRALGVASTLNEVTFVLAPVMASGLGSISPVLAILAMTVIGAIPILSAPDFQSTPMPQAKHVEGSLFQPRIMMWLICAVAGSSTVAAVEIGAVALALDFGYQPVMAVLFTVPLCVASVSGGIWVSVRNRAATHNAVVVQLSIMSLGAILAALHFSIATTILGAVLIGSMLAPLGTHYALILDTLAPPEKRPELFALLRTANAIGIIVASGMLTVLSLSTALGVASALMCVVAVGAGVFSITRRAKE
jgi:MFS family permease